MPEAGWKKLSAEEQRLASKWSWEQGKPPSEIASLLDRDKSTLTRFLVKQVSRKKQGRPCVLTNANIDFLERRVLRNSPRSLQIHYQNNDFQHPAVLGPPGGIPAPAEPARSSFSGSRPVVQKCHSLVRISI